jgi:hypothetical protein
MVMKIRLILIGMMASLALPLAGADAATVFDSGLKQAAAGTSIEHGAARTGESFWRQEDEDKGDKDHKCDKDDKGDRDRDCDCRDRDDHRGKCEKSPGKPK